MSFAGTVTIESRDDAAHRVVLSAKGMEQKGKGAANAKVTSWLEPGPTDGVTTVKMEADITLTGAAAQLSRGLLPEISKKLTQHVRRLPAGVDGRGADRRAKAMRRPPRQRRAAAAAPASPVVAKPVGGIGLGHRGDLVDHRELLPQALRAQAQVVVR